MVKIKEDKKREVLLFLENAVKTGKWFELDEEAVISKLKDEDFNEEDIKIIIDGLKNDNSILERDISLKIIFPKRMKEKIEQKLKNFMAYSSFWGYLAALLIMAYVFSDEGIYNWFLSTNNYSAHAGFLMAIAIGAVGVFVIERILFRIADFMLEKIPIIKEYRFYIYPVIAIGLVITLIVCIWAFINSQTIDIIHVLTIISISILGGIPIGLKNKK